jgi:hypothetical protein
MGGPELPAGSTPVAGSQVDASGMTTDQPRLVWVTGNGSTIGFYAVQSGCETVTAKVAAQTSAKVTIQVVQLRSATKACPMYEVNKPMKVTLAQPLGHRTVVLQQVVEHG